MGRQSRAKRNRRLGLAPTIERSRRCQNCMHWENGEMAIKRYKELRHRDLDAAAAKILSGEGAPPGLSGKRLVDSDIHSKHNNIRSSAPNLKDIDVRMRMLGINYDMGDHLMRQGALGICVAGRTEGDFVKFNYLCDHWSGRIVPDGADEGDELSEEAKDRLGYDE